jgi:hypothetical protein
VDARRLQNLSDPCDQPIRRLGEIASQSAERCLRALSGVQVRRLVRNAEIDGADGQAQPGSPIVDLD